MTSNITTHKHAIEDVALDQALGERYLSYALSTIMARSLPDVRDGLKPVHRRILYAMWESGNTHLKSYRKSASAVGYVMMRYHPHGDSAIYDALVRMAQDFAMRYPLIDGQGNFGSIDGDNAAAMRYTEARLFEISRYLLEGIDENAVDFQPTYNDERQEPRVLPAIFPNLLANGATGIAVGMATNIPPHNVSEICQALRAMIQKPDLDTTSLMAMMRGPDFPTGGVIVESPESLRKIYETGRGSIRLRARWEVEKLKGSQYQIIVTQIPYQIQKAKLIEKISELFLAKRLPLLGDIADESASDIRLIFQPKSATVSPELLMESLFRLCDLEVRFAVNMNVVDKDGVPRVMSLAQILQAFLDHCHDVLCRRTQHRLEQILDRLNLLNGLLIAYLNLDEVIRIIRFEDTPKVSLIAAFQLNELQADAILNMRLKALRKLEEMQIRQEHDALVKEQTTLEALLASDKLRWKKIDKQIAEIQDRFGEKHPMGLRRTDFQDAPQYVEIPIEAHIEKEPVTIVCSAKGWIRALKGHNLDSDDIKYKDGDEAGFILKAHTTDKILLFATNGRFYTLAADKIPGGRGFGTPLTMMADLPAGVDVLCLSVYQGSAQELLVVASNGYGFRVRASDVLAQTKSGKQILNVAGNVTAAHCCSLPHEMLAVMGSNRKLLVFPVAEVPLMTRGKGVKIQSYRDGQFSDAVTFAANEGISWPMGSRTRTETDLTPWWGRRGQSGRLAPIGFPRSNKFEPVALKTPAAN